MCRCGGLVTFASRTAKRGRERRVTTSFYPPFLAARLLSMLDHITRGRIGANLVMRAAAFGRDPDEIKVVFLISPVLGATGREAEAKWERMVAATAINLEANLAFLSYYSGIDYAKLDLDEPIPHLQTNASRSTIVHTREQSAGMNLREYASAPARSTVELIGSPDSVAKQMGEVADAIGGDGFLISLPRTRRNISEVTEGLALALRKRGLIRDGYAHAHLSDTLRELCPWCAGSVTGGSRLLLALMSEVPGGLSVMVGNYHLKASKAGRCVPGVRPAEPAFKSSTIQVTVISGGMAGENAVQQVVAAAGQYRHLRDAS